MSDFMAQVQRDFEGICAGEFSEKVTVTDGTDTVTLDVLFDEATAQFNPETQSSVNIPEPHFAVAETATAFNLRRGGLVVTARGKTYKTRASDWEQDGLGQLVVYLDLVRPQP